MVLFYICMIDLWSGADSGLSVGVPNLTTRVASKILQGVLKSCRGAKNFIMVLNIFDLFKFFSPRFPCEAHGVPTMPIWHPLNPPLHMTY